MLLSVSALTSLLYSDTHLPFSVVLTF